MRTKRKIPFMWIRIVQAVLFFVSCGVWQAAAAADVVILPIQAGRGVPADLRTLINADAAETFALGGQHRVVSSEEVRNALRLSRRSGERCLRKPDLGGCLA